MDVEKKKKDLISYNIKDSSKKSGGCGKKSHRKRSKEKKKLKSSKKHKKEKRKKLKKALKRTLSESETDKVADVPVELMDKSKAMAPMTKEEWEKRQSIIRRVYDEKSGRHRLIKGDGEVIEEIVSRERHKEINKTATLGDGDFFQSEINKRFK